jgi:hypothetical protein
MTTKYGSKGNSGKDSSPFSTDSSRSGTGPEGTFFGLSRSGSKAKAKNAFEKELNDESSFKEAHEYGLEALSPVAQGYGDDLVPPMQEAHMRSLNDKLTDRKVASRIEHTQGPGSWVISPSPSVSSDEDVSLVQKKHTHDGLPYGLPTREDDDSWGINLRRELESRGGGEPREESNWGIALSSPLAETFMSQNQIAGVASPLSPGGLGSYSRNPTPGVASALSPIDLGSHSRNATPGIASLLSPLEQGAPTPRIRRKLSKEKWRQVYEQEARHAPPTPPK